MKNLENMSYQELVELEKQIADLKKKAKGRLTKGETTNIIYEMFGRKLVYRLKKEGYSEEVSYHAFYPMATAIHKLCDMTYGNYRPLKSKKVKTMIVPSTNGATIMVEDSEGYKKLACDIALLVCKAIGDVE